MASYTHADLSSIIHTDGSMTRVLAEFPIDRTESTRPGPRLRAVTRDLEAAGSPQSDIATANSSFEEHSDDRDQIPRFVLIHDGEVVLDELLPAVHLHDNEASFGVTPSLIPVVMQRQREFPFVVLEASAGGGRIRTFLDGRLNADSDEVVEGDTEHLHDAKGGGYPHSRHEHHTEEVWKRNETELADMVNRIVEDNQVDLVIVTGDPQVVDLVASALSLKATSVLAKFASDTIADGASTDELDVFLSENLQRLASDHQADVIERAGSQEGANYSTTDLRLQPIVHALQQAGVATLLLDLEALESHSLLSLAGEPWVAAVKAETFGAEILGTGSAADALTRAAIATSAEVVFVDHDALPGGASAAIIHR